MAAAQIDWSTQIVSYAGLGNIAGALASPAGQLKRMVSHNGTAGHNARKIQAFDYPSGDGLLLMHSDGINSRWSFEGSPAAARSNQSRHACASAWYPPTISAPSVSTESRSQQYR